MATITTPDLVRQLGRSYLDIEACEAGAQDVPEVSGDEEPIHGIDLEADTPGSPMLQTFAPPGRKAKKSWLWEYFIKLGSSKEAMARCKLCQVNGRNQDIARHDGSTRDMGRHLKNEHGITKAGQQQLSGSVSAKNATPYPPRSREKAQLSWKIARFIVVNKRPFNIVSTDEFKDMFKQADPRYEMMSRKKVKTTAKSMYKATKSAVNEVMCSLWQYFPSYTCDLWTASDGSQYIALQLHVIDGQFRFALFSSGAVPIPPPHAAEDIAKCIDSVLKSFEFTGQYKVSCTTDWGGNIKLACDEILKHDWLPCFDHITHNVLGDMKRIDQFDVVVSKARTLCSMFRTSPKKWEELRQIQLKLIKSLNNLAAGAEIEEEDEQEFEDVGLDLSEEFVPKLTQVLRIKTDVVTRWNSILAMLSRLVILQKAVDMWFSEHDAVAAERLTNHEWIQIYDIVDILGLFKDITVDCQAREEPQIVYLLPQLLRLTSRLLPAAGMHAERFSGRSAEMIRKHRGLESEDSAMQIGLSDIQKEMVDIILHGYFGDKQKAAGALRQQEGRANNFQVIFSWSICAAIDCANLNNWDKRVTQPLNILLRDGYLKAAHAATEQAYISDMLGNETGGCVEQSAGEQSSDDDAGGGAQGETEGREGDAGIEAEPSNGAQELGQGKRRRIANKRYTSSPAAKKTKSQKGKRRRKGSSIAAQRTLPSFGQMLKELAIDELRRMAMDLVEDVASPAVQTPGSGDVTPAPVAPGRSSTIAMKKRMCNFSDDDEPPAVTDHLQGNDATNAVKVGLEIELFQKEPAHGYDLLQWWKLNTPRYPLLSQIARRIMAVKATSAEAERDFSHAGFVASKNRLQLNWESMQICTFCSLNKDLVPRTAPSKYFG